MQREQERDMYDPQSPVYFPTPSVLPQIDRAADWGANVSPEIASPEAKARPSTRLRMPDAVSMARSREIQQSSAERTKQK